jgi:hypothetical protein
MITGGFRPRRIEVVHNGIDAGVEPAAAARDLARMKLRVAEDDFVVGTAARLDPVRTLARRSTRCRARGQGAECRPRRHRGHPGTHEEAF